MTPPSVDRAEEDWTALLLESMDDGLLMLDCEGRILCMNRAAEGLLGAARDQARGSQLWDLSVFSTCSMLAHEKWRAVRGGGSASFTAFLGGVSSWVEVCVRPIGPGVSVRLRDVTESESTERALGLSEEYFRALVETTEEMITILGPGGRISYENPAVERVLGQHQEERIGKSVFGSVHPDDAPRVIDTFTNRIRLSGSTASVRYRCRRSDGTWRVLNSTAKNLADHPAVAGVVIVSRDITVEEEAESAQSQLSSILDSSTDLVMTADPLGRVRYLNRAARVMIGIPDHEEVSRLNLPDFYPHRVTQQIITEGMPAALREGAWSAEVQILRRDGREIPVSLVLLAHQSASGALEFFSMTARDITERRRAEEKLRQSQKMDAIGRLAGGVAHDFNNVLMAIKSNAYFLLADLPEDDPRREDARQIDVAADRAASLTRQLLAFSRQQVLQPQVLSLNAVVSQMDKMLRRLIGENIELVTEIDPGLGVVEADRGQMEQVLLNLAVNARDAMPGGGRLVIRTANTELDEQAARFYPHLELGTPTVLLSVSDTGTGIDREIQEQIFDPFFTTKEQGKGTGLGLATVYGIVKQSGGYIWVESELGRGSTFRIYLPRKDGVSPSSTEPARAALPAGGAETILLVEDEAPVRKATRRALQRLGYSVLEASDGAEAVELARDQSVRIDLLLTDVVMPGMSGPQLAELLRSGRPDLRVLYMSGYTNDRLDGHGVSALGAAFLEKPFAPEALSRTVREMLDTGFRTESARC